VSLARHCRSALVWPRFAMASFTSSLISADDALPASSLALASSNLALVSSLRLFTSAVLSAIVPLATYSLEFCS